MPIPRIVHQLWKTDRIPPRWRQQVASVRRYHSGWEYRLWTDDAMDRYVRTRHASFYPVFAGFNRQIMRVDTFRYILMQDFGGLYCDLDYEFVRPFDYGDAEVVLSLEYDRAFGDEENQLANYVFASAPGHRLWSDMLARLAANPPFASTASEVCIVTGPKLVTATYYEDPRRYDGVRVLPKPVLSPQRVHGPRERKFYVNSMVTYGFHHGWGSWKERWNLEYLARKLSRRLGRKPPSARRQSSVSAERAE